MAKFANIRPEQINKARRMLQDLPEKTERKTRQEAALLLESDLRKALKKGWETMALAWAFSASRQAE